MNRTRPLPRIAALAGLFAATLIAFAAPAMAGPAEDAVLAQYLGSWKGRGTLTSDAQETVVCRLDMTEGNQGKVNFGGRCSLAGATIGMAGTIAYFDEPKHYEAAMTSTMFSGVAVGVRQGNNILFDLQQRNQQEGMTYQISAQIALQDGDAINVAFRIVNVATGGVTSASVPFTK